MRIVTAAVSLAMLAMAPCIPAAAQAGGEFWTVSGELQDSDSQGEEQHRYDDHALRLEAGVRYRLWVNSEAFDPMARLLRSGQTEPVAQNDDYGESLNSRISFTPRESGDYVLRVLGFAADARGAYSARAERLPPLPAPIEAPPGSTTTTTWGVWEGEIATTDAERDGRHYDDYLVHIGADQSRIVAVDADGFDTMIEILRPADREDEALAQDDDSGPALNPMLVFAPEDEGDYIVRVMAFEENASGRYRLRISQ